jgi:hypothetical protein
MEDGNLVEIGRREATNADSLTGRPEVGAAGEEDVSKMLTPRADGDVQWAVRRRGKPASRVHGWYAVAKPSASRFYIGTVCNQELDGSIIPLFGGDMKRRPEVQIFLVPGAYVPVRSAQTTTKVRPFDQFIDTMADVKIFGYVAVHGCAIPCKHCQKRKQEWTAWTATYILET